MNLPNKRKVIAIPKIKSALDSKKSNALFFFFQPRPKSQWGTISKKGWEKAERVIPRVGLLGVDAAIAPPIIACAVAVMSNKCTTPCQFESNTPLW